MRIGDYLRYAMGALRRIPLRSILTVGGVSIGIAAMVLLVGFGVQTERNLVKQLAGQEELKTITVFSPRLQEEMIRRRRGMRQPQGDQAAKPSGTPLNDETLDALRILPGVSAAYPNVFFVTSVLYGEGVEPGCVGVGLSPGTSDSELKSKLAAGDVFTSASAREVILTRFLAEELAGREQFAEIVGETISLAYLAKPDPKKNGEKGEKGEKDEQPLLQPKFGQERFVVVGVLDHNQHLRTTQSSFREVSFNSVILPLEEARRMYGIADNPQNFARRLREGGDDYLIASVVVTDGKPEVIERVREQIEDRGLRTFHVYDVLEMVKIVFIALNLFLLALGSVALVVATLQIANTMTMSVLERTREIGVMKAIGARDRDIRRLFLGEAAIIGALGAAGGVAMAWVGGRGVELILKTWLANADGAAMLEETSLFAMPAWLVGAAFGFGIFVSLLAAFFPAWRASRIEPATALRRE